MVATQKFEASLVEPGKSLRNASELAPSLHKEVVNHGKRADSSYRKLGPLRPENPLPAGLHVRRRHEDSPSRYARRLDLIDALARELVDVDDGLPVVSAVTRPAFENSGSRAASLPHLLLHFRHNICSCAVTSARLGRIEAPGPGNIRSGNHMPGGFAFAVGPSTESAMAQIKTMKDFASLAAKVLSARQQERVKYRS